MGDAGNPLYSYAERAQNNAKNSMQTIDQRRNDDLKSQFAPLQQALVSAQTQMAALLDSDPDSPTYGKPLPQHEARYNELHDQAADIIGKSRLLFHPPTPEDPHGLKYLGARVADKMHITNHLADQMRQAQGDKAAADRTAGRKKDYQNATIAAEGAVPPPPGGLTADEQHEANRIKSNMDPKAGTSKDAPENWQTLDVKFADGTTQTVQRNTKDGRFTDLAGNDIPPEKLSTAKAVPKPTADHAPITKSLLINGKAHVVAWNPETKKFDRDMGEAPPTYAQIAPGLKGWELSARTMVQQGEDGLPHVFQFNPASRQYEETGGLKLSGTASNQAFQGAAIQKLGSKIINDIQSNKELMGNLSSYATQYLNGTPISDPAAATLIADLESFSSTQPALHGFRSRTAQQAFSKILGGLANNPEATISTIEALSATASTFTNLATPEGPKTKELRSTAGGTIVQHSKSTGKYRYSTDGGKTWQPGQPQSQTTGKQ